MIKQAWTFGKFRKRINSQIVAPSTLPACEDALKTVLNESRGDLPQIRASVFNAFYPALVLACVNRAVSDPEISLKALHLIWRLKAISLSAYLEYMDRLFEKRSRPRIRPLGVFDVNDVLMLAISGSVLGTADAARYFFSKALSFVDASPLRVDPKAFRSGPVEPFVFNLGCRFFGEGGQLEIPDSGASRVFRNIEAHWGSGEFDSAAKELLDVKATKLLSRSLDNDLVFGLNTSVNFFVPFEYLFLMQVRQKLGFTRTRADHELLNLPVCLAMPDFMETGRNSHIEKLLFECQQLLPGFSLSWEERFSQLPPCEFRDVLVDV